MTANVFSDAGGDDFSLAMISNEHTGVYAWLKETDLRTWETECCGLIETFPDFDRALDWALTLTASVDENEVDK